MLYKKADLTSSTSSRHVTPGGQLTAINLSRVTLSGENFSLFGLSVARKKVLKSMH